MMDEEIIFHGKTPPYEPTKGGIGFETHRLMKIHKDKVAEIYIESGESCTYNDLLERSVKLALFLRSKNLKKDDLVCLCSHNQMNSSIPFYASKFIDVGYSSFEPTMPEEDVYYLFNMIKPKIVFVAETVEEKIENSLRKLNIKCEIIIFGKSDRNITMEEIFNKNYVGEENFEPVFIENLKETAMIFLSSGTTGKPKGICSNHYALLAQCVNLAHHLLKRGVITFNNFTCEIGVDHGKSRVNNILYYSPMYWISGITLLLMGISIGGFRTIGDVFNATSAWKAIEKYKPTLIFLPPGLLIDLYLCREQNLQLTDIDVFLTGGGPTKRHHLEYINEMFPKAVALCSLGMTELSVIISSFSASDEKSVALQKKYLSSCGKLSYGISCKIVDVDTERSCKINELGELRLKSKYLMNGYYNMDSSSSFDSKGWFKTGDLVYMNEDHCLHVVDRLKDLLLYTLYNIRPSVIENILVRHPSVYEAIVIGVPHIQDNEHPLGMVVLKEEYKNKTTPEEIIKFVNDRVPSDRYKIRAGVEFVEEMIKTPTGKIKKLAMKEMVIKRGM